MCVLTKFNSLSSQLLSHMEAHCLKDEGILRIPGHSVRVNGLQQDLEASFNTGGYSFSGIKTSDLSSVLKQFVRYVLVVVNCHIWCAWYALNSYMEHKM